MLLSAASNSWHPAPRRGRGSEWDHNDNSGGSGASSATCRKTNPATPRRYSAFGQGETPRGRAITGTGRPKEPGVPTCLVEREHHQNRAGSIADATRQCYVQGRTTKGTKGSNASG